MYLNQSKEYIEELIRKHFIHFDYIIGSNEETIDTYLSLLNKCNKDKDIIRDLYFKDIIRDYVFIIGVNENWRWFKYVLKNKRYYYISNYPSGFISTKLENKLFNLFSNFLLYI